MVDISRRDGSIISNLESALQGVEVILITRLASRIMRRQFGGGVIELLGRLVNPHLFGVFYQIVGTAIDLWEPRFKVRQVIFDGSAEEIRRGHATLQIQADYRPRGHLGDFTVERVLGFGVSFAGGNVRIVP
ncbi:GPW/gp25 family protein [Roseibium sp.]|uniref:GPW/gp25 family protein n=1 Tax=Roseibium sp. TaxID=1936156 RepID=UPI003B52CA5F